MSRRRANIRLLTATLVLLLGLGAMTVRAFQIQVLAAEQYQERAKDQQVSHLEVAPARGVIYDRNGAELAVSQRTATIYATPYLVDEPEAAASQLAEVLGLPEADVLASLRRRSGFSYVVRKVDAELGRQVAALEIRGIGVYPEEKRVYPRGALAPQVLGYVGTDNVGLAGLEGYYDDLLAGEAGRRDVVRDPFGRSLEILLNQEGRPGDSLVLTLDEDIQFTAEEVLQETVERFAAKGASAIVMDPRTGDLLAVANAPVFDTNDFGEAEQSARRNSAVTDQYEPGSTFKMLVVAAALEEGLVTPDTVYELGPTIQVYDRTIHEAHENLPAVRNLSVTQILAQSSNVGSVKLGLQVGKEKLVDMIRRFGFTHPLGVDFPGEAGGMMLPPEEWSGATIANVPIGHGISVTPLQMAAAYSTIANDGVQVTPHFRRWDEPGRGERVIDPEVAGQLREMLRVTVSDGTGRGARVAGYEVAGKTGTAQKVREDGRGYAQDRFISSFVGMVPVDDPRLVILVVVDEPTVAYYGSEVAAPAFAEIADFSLKHLEIAPDRLGAAESD